MLSQLLSVPISGRNESTYALTEFQKENPGVKAYVIGTIERPRLLKGDIEALPWKTFLDQYLPRLMAASL